MELWVRSQDKTSLSNVHDLIIRENQNENNEINYVIQDLYTLGTYKTKERALEVLDDIEYFISSKDIDGNRRYEFDVYQMPED